jgi:tetratricopeptide (TPR) repeat protein
LGIVLGKLGRFDEALSEFFVAARLDTTLAQPHFLIGQMLLQQGRDLEATPHLQAGLKLEPDNPKMLIFTANVLAADENPQVRNGTEARVLAENAIKLTGGQQFAVLDVLSMAWAEIGQFDEALQIQQHAIQLAEAAGQKDDLALMQQRLQLYLARQPWRESFKKTASER